MLPTLILHSSAWQLPHSSHPFVYTEDTGTKITKRSIHQQYMIILGSYHPHNTLQYNISTVRSVTSLSPDHRAPYPLIMIHDSLSASFHGALVCKPFVICTRESTEGLELLPYMPSFMAALFSKASYRGAQGRSSPPQSSDPDE